MQPTERSTTVVSATPTRAGPIPTACGVSSSPSRSTDMQRSLVRGRLVIFGQQGGTNVGASLERAANRASLPTTFVDAALGSAAPRLLRAAMWRLGHRPARLE